MNDKDPIDHVKLVTDVSAEQLNEKQIGVYHDHRKRLARWALSIGKNPLKAKGYATETVKQRFFRLDKFYRFVWDEEDRFTVDVTPDHADAWMRKLAYQNNTQTYNAACQKAVKMLFKWMRDDLHKQVSWDPELTYSSSSPANSKQHYFGLDTLKKLLESSLTYGSLPNPYNVSPAERNRIEGLIAQKIGKPKSEVTLQDWDEQDSYMVPAMLFVTVDCGFRNKEVRELRTEWIDWDESCIRISGEYAVKSDEPWTAAVRSTTLGLLRRWIEERGQFEKYADNDYVFLNQYGNPYAVKSLNILIRDVCDHAGLDSSEVTWYSLRRSMLTHFQGEASLKDSMVQGRHTRPETTARYDQAPVERRKKVLEEVFS